jgi:hypothetical protein
MLATWQLEEPPKLLNNSVGVSPLSRLINSINTLPWQTDKLFIFQIFYVNLSHTSLNTFFLIRLAFLKNDIILL